MDNNTPKVDEDPVLKQIQDLILACGGDPQAFQGELITQMIQTSLKLFLDGHDLGQLKLLNRSLKELRYAYRIFNLHPREKCVSIFGSARTPESHPDYKAAREFSMEIAKQDWYCITGAADGIMKAGLEGPKPEATFGLSIRLPMESTVNSVIEGNPKLITFRYFFTRKLMFMSHSDAAAVFPGGYGTLDELFEFLTLIQTGRTNIIPIVLLEGEGGNYWEAWDAYVKEQLLSRAWISPADIHLYYKAVNIQDGIKHIQKFYQLYHSSRYVKDLLVIRIRRPLSDKQIEQLNDRFSILFRSGKLEQGLPLPEETDHLQFPRLLFEHTRRDFGILRQLIDAINDYA